MKRSFIHSFFMKTFTAYTTSQEELLPAIFRKRNSKTSSLLKHLNRQILKEKRQEFITSYSEPANISRLIPNLQTIHSQVLG